MQKFLIGLACAVWASGSLVAQETDKRAEIVQELKTPRTFPKIASKADWQADARQIREQVLVSCGLWPMPEKTPLNAQVSGKVERDGYSIEKVYLETFPGFYLAGNLYRPLGKKGPFPAVLNPHGHWAYGRFNDQVEGSIPARCISFARQGYVAFSYDMVGYNDTFFADQPNVSATATNVNFYPRHRQFATNEACMLWNISLMGLQTWNSIRAVDFLETLKDVDPKRIGVTGASGGGTETFILGAIDDRLAVQAPVCMVSSTMQGGCSCENVSGLRVDHSNMEIAAAAAPRPQLLIGATGDWTKQMMSVEGPAVQSAYNQLGKEDNLHFLLLDAPHNYNQNSREHVYDWFAQWLHPAAPVKKEAAYTVEPVSELRVFPDGQLPTNALTIDKFTTSRMEAIERAFIKHLPTNSATFAGFQKTFLPAWQHTLQVEFPVKNLRVDFGSPKSFEDALGMPLRLHGTKRGDSVPAMLLTPVGFRRNTVVVLASAEGRKRFVGEQGPIGLAAALINRGYSVVTLDTFLTGESADAKAIEARKKQVDLFFTCYNRTDTQERVQDLITACTFARTLQGNPEVVLVGEGVAGLWTMLAAPAADALVADCDKLNSASDKDLLKPEIFVPGLRNIGSFEGVAALAAPHPTLLHNVSDTFGYEIVTDVYGRVKSLPKIRVVNQQLNAEGISRWLEEFEMTPKRKKKA